MKYSVSEDVSRMETEKEQSPKSVWRTASSEPDCQRISIFVPFTSATIFAFAEKTGNWFLIRKSSICFCTIGFFIPAAISEHVRFVRLISLCPPSKMLKSTYGAYEQMESSAVLNAEPLCSYAQMTSAKLVIELPSAENVCVDHRRRNGPNAVRAGLSQSFGKNLNAENFF